MRQNLEEVGQVARVREEELAHDTDEEDHEDGALISNQGGVARVLHKGTCDHAEADLVDVPDRQHPESQPDARLLEEFDLNVPLADEKPEDHREFQHYEVVNEEARPVGFRIEPIDLQQRFNFFFFFHREDVEHDRESETETDREKSRADQR